MQLRAAYVAVVAAQSCMPGNRSTAAVVAAVVGISAVVNVAVDAAVWSQI